MKKLLLLGAILASSLVAVAGFAMGPGGKATGGVTGVAPGNVGVQFQFNAHEQGPKGKAKFKNTSNGTFFHGTVDCFYQIDANTVAFSGVVTKANAPGWDFFIAWVQDNGEPAGDDWFRASVGVDTDCVTHPWTVNGVPAAEQWPVTAGNLQVH